MISNLLIFVQLYYFHVHVMEFKRLVFVKSLMEVIEMELNG